MRGRSDNEILAWIKRVGGTDAFLEQTFSGMCDAFRADRAVGQSRGDRVGHPHARSRRRQLSGAWSNRARVARSAVRPLRRASCWRIDMPNFLRLVIGALDGEEAFESGKLEVSGRSRSWRSQSATGFKGATDAHASSTLDAWLRRALLALASLRDQRPLCRRRRGRRLGRRRRRGHVRRRRERQAAPRFGAACERTSDCGRQLFCDTEVDLS